MERSVVYTTTFITLDDQGLDAFVKASFTELEYHAKSFVNQRGTYHITMNIEAFDMDEAKTQALQLEEVALKELKNDQVRC